MWLWEPLQARKSNSNGAAPQSWSMWENHKHTSVVIFSGPWYDDSGNRYKNKVLCFSLQLSVFSILKYLRLHSCLIKMLDFLLCCRVNISEMPCCCLKSQKYKRKDIYSSMCTARSWSIATLNTIFNPLHTWTSQRDPHHQAHAHTAKDV